MIDSTKVQEIYNAIKEKAFSDLYAGENLKEQEEKIKKKAAEAKGLVDKEGKPDSAKIKSPLIKKSIEKFLTQKDKLKEDHDTMEEYLSLIKNNKISREDITTFTTLKELKKDEASELNALKKSKESEVDPATFSAILMLIKEDIEKYKKNIKDDGEGDSDFKPQNNEELFEKIKEVRKIIRGLK